MRQSEEQTQDKQGLNVRYEELKVLLCDYGLLCKIVAVKDKTKIYIQTDNPYEEYTNVYDDDERAPWTDIARIIIDDYVNTFQFI